MKEKVSSIAKIGAVLGSAAYLTVGIVQFNRIDNSPRPISHTVVAASVEEVVTADKKTQKLIAEQPVKISRSNIVRSREWNADEAYLLAKIAMAEAEGEDIDGKALVLLVVLNREQSKEFPNSIREVIYQESQFSSISNGRWDGIEPNQECYEALDMVAMGWDESQGATYFESRSDSAWHQENLDFLFRHGGHYFYKGKGE